jgi:ABC-2 type transport system ATP-binding protein
MDAGMAMMHLATGVSLNVGPEATDVKGAGSSGGMLPRTMSIPDGLPAVALRASDLTKRYGDLTAVHNLSFDVLRGEVLGFLGPNGAGKTTTLKMLCGLLRADHGHVEVDGHLLNPDAPQAVRAIGVAPQSVVIWDALTCLEQLEFVGRMYGMGRAAARREARALLATFGLEDKTHRLGRTLSGGMQRRLNIALALVHGPALLFLDEPQAGLDPQSRVLVRDYIRSIAGRATVIVTTHDMDEAEKVSDRVCIIDHGRLLAIDTVAGIKEGLGEGDLVEIEVVAKEASDLASVLEGLRGRLQAAVVHDHTLRFTSTDAAAEIPEVLAAIRDRGWRLAHLRTRPRTLEDVFIRLTGRGLRE